jgi:hypothetical protein
VQKNYQIYRENLTLWGMGGLNNSLKQVEPTDWDR